MERVALGTCVILALFLDTIGGATTDTSDLFHKRVRGSHGGNSGHLSSTHQQSRYPLYMMHLYRTLLAGEAHRSPADLTRRSIHSDKPNLHDSDSVLSLVAKSKHIFIAYV